MSICEDYVSFETAKLLKEKGFDEPVQMYIKTYNYPSDIVIQNIKKITGKNVEQIEVHSLFNSEDEPFFNSVEGKDENLFAYPTLQMAMKWLREIHKLFIFISPWLMRENNIQYYFEIREIKTRDFKTLYDYSSIKLNSFEKVAETAIKYCLENLI